MVSGNQALGSFLRLANSTVVIGHGFVEELVSGLPGNRRKPAPTRKNLVQEMASLGGICLSEPPLTLEQLIAQGLTNRVLSRFEINKQLRERLLWEGSTDIFSHTTAGLYRWSNFFVNFSFVSIMGHIGNRLGKSVDVVVRDEEMCYLTPGRTQEICARGLLVQPETTLFTEVDFAARLASSEQWRSIGSRHLPLGVDSLPSVWEHTAARLSGSTVVMLGMDAAEVDLLYKHILRPFGGVPLRTVVFARPEHYTNEEVHFVQSEYGVPVCLIGGGLTIAGFIHQVMVNL